jgi:hypothetical protein
MSKNHNPENINRTGPRTLKGDLNYLKDKYPKTTAVLAGTAIAASLLTVGPKAIDHFNGPDFSESTTTYTVKQGDGLQVVVNNIEGINQVDWRDAAHHVKNMPENESVFENNQLDPGEMITIPESVTP